jgi:flagellar basal-body rod protein FlgG
MERGLYIAATGMMSDMVRQDVIASNLANVNTVGFKADKVVNETFSDLFLRNLRDGVGVGSINLGTRVAGTVTDYSQGAMRATENKLDVAIGGDGFFAVQTPTGVRFTRNGQFTRNPDGFLTDQLGNYVIGADRQRIQVGTGDPVVTVDGRIYDASGAYQGTIGVFTIDVANARKVGDNQWVGRATGARPDDTQLRQGFVEASGVNSVHEMIEMITTLRSYESSQRVITSIDGTLDKAVNQVGVVQ